MSLPKYKIYKMNDSSEDYRVHKDGTWDLPMRLIICGRSLLSGKTNFLGNLALRPYGDDDVDGKGFYRDEFEGRDIHIFCPSTIVDTKWQSIIKGKEIPSENIHDRYHEQELLDLYDILEQQYYDAIERGDKPTHKLIILDDCSFGGNLKDKMNGAIARLASNGRHFLLSLICTTQKYSDCLTTLRENASGMVLYGCSNKQAELIYNDVGEEDKKSFMEKFRRATKQKHSFMVVNYTNDPDKRFLDSNFQPLQ